MAKEAVVQLRMDAEMKEQVEALYRSLGTSFAEGIRMFAAQSLRVNGIPFAVTADRVKPASGTEELAGALRRYAAPEKLAREAEALHSAFEEAAIEKLTGSASV